MTDGVLHKARAIGWKRIMDAEIAQAQAEGKRVVMDDGLQQASCPHVLAYVCRGCRHKPMRRTYVCPDCHKQWDEWIDQ